MKRKKIWLPMVLIFVIIGIAYVSILLASGRDITAKLEAAANREITDVLEEPEKTITFYSYHANWNPFSKRPFSAAGHVMVEFCDDGVWGLGLNGIEPETYNLGRPSERKKQFYVTNQQYQAALVVLEDWRNDPARYSLLNRNCIDLGVDVAIAIDLTFTGNHFLFPTAFIHALRCKQSAGCPIACR